MGAVWLAYLLGLASWIPIVAVAVIIGRLLARARRTQSRHTPGTESLGSGAGGTGSQPAPKAKEAPL
ncbi:MAG TPA: hypothetical protein VMA53_19245 [Stellaceae bacterium]|nr:hypothetical protein [Stellaceae bacterium]